MPGNSLVRACMLDSKGVGWHQAPRWFHLKFIMNCFEEKIWSLSCLCIVVCFYWLPLKLYIILRNIILKRFWYPHFIQIDTQCYYSSLHCRVQFEMCYPTLLYGPILLVILRNVPPYSVISHSSVIWNSGVMEFIHTCTVRHGTCCSESHPNLLHCCWLFEPSYVKTHVL